MNDLVQVHGLYKHYDNGLVRALCGVDLSLKSGEIVALTGRSGCGKSTLLNLIGTLDMPSGGQIRYQGKSISEFGPINRFRSEFIGFIFQFHHLIPVLTVRENIEAAVLNQKHLSTRTRRKMVTELLEKMAIAHRADFLLINYPVVNVSGWQLPEH